MDRMWFKLGILAFVLSIFGLFGNFFLLFAEASGIHIGCIVAVAFDLTFFILGISALIIGAITRLMKEKNILVLLSIIFGINSIWLNIIFLTVVAAGCAS